MVFKTILGRNIERKHCPAQTPVGGFWLCQLTNATFLLTFDHAMPQSFEHGYATVL